MRTQDQRAFGSAICTCVDLPTSSTTCVTRPRPSASTIRLTWREGLGRQKRPLASVRSLTSCDSIWTLAPSTAAPEASTTTPQTMGQGSSEEPGAVAAAPGTGPGTGIESDAAAVSRRVGATSVTSVVIFTGTTIDEGGSFHAPSAETSSGSGGGATGRFARRRCGSVLA